MNKTKIIYTFEVYHQASAKALDTAVSSMKKKKVTVPPSPPSRTPTTPTTMPKSPAAAPALPPPRATMYEPNFDGFPSEENALNETPNLIFILSDLLLFCNYSLE